MPQASPNPGVVLANTPLITNLLVVNANEEVAFAIPDNTQQITLKARTPTAIQFSYIVNESNSDFISIEPGGVYRESQLDLTGRTLYLRTGLPNITIEILSWSRV